MYTNISAAIFDMDGTILDSGAMWDQVPFAVVRRLGYVPKATLRADVRPLEMREFAPFLREDYGMQEPVEEIHRITESIVRHYYRHKAALKPGALEFLRRLKAAGVPLALATATERYLLEPALAAAGVLPLLDAVCTCREAGHDKRRPDVYFQAAQALGTEPAKVWVFEDALYAVETAKAAGFHVCAVADPAFADCRSRICDLADCFLAHFADWQTLPFAACLA